MERQQMICPEILKKSLWNQYLFDFFPQICRTTEYLMIVRPPQIFLKSQMDSHHSGYKQLIQFVSSQLAKLQAWTSYKKIYITQWQYVEEV